MQFDSWGPPKSWTAKQVTDYKKKVFPDRWIKKLKFMKDGGSLLNTDSGLLKNAGFKTPQAIGMILRLVRPILEMANKAVRDEKESKASKASKKKGKKKGGGDDLFASIMSMDLPEDEPEAKEEAKEDAPPTPQKEEAKEEPAEATPAADPANDDEDEEEAFLRKSREAAKKRREAKKAAEAAKKAANAAKRAALEEERKQMEIEAAEQAKKDEEERLAKEAELANRAPCTTEPTLAFLKAKNISPPSKAFFTEMQDKDSKAQNKILKKLKKDKEWAESTIFAAIDEILSSKNPPPEEDEDLDGGVENWPPGTRVKVMGFDVTWQDPLMNGFGKIKYAIHTGMEDNYVIEIQDRGGVQGLATDITVPGYQLDDLIKLPDQWDTDSLKCMVECLKGRTKYVEISKKILVVEKDIAKLSAKYKNTKKKSDQQIILTKKKDLNENQLKLSDKRRNMVNKIKECEATTNKTIEWNERFGNAVYVDGITERTSDEIRPILEACGLKVDKIGPVEASRNDFALGCVVYLENKELCTYAAKTLKVIDVGEDISEEKKLKFTQPVPQNMGNVVKAMKYMKRVKGL